MFRVLQLAGGEVIQPWCSLADDLSGTALAPWSGALAQGAQAALEQSRHGDLGRWLRAIGNLPPAEPVVELDRDMPVLGGDLAEAAGLRELLQELHPWRKGPLCLGGVRVDSEWRSDWKWDRIAPHVDLRGHVVLDVGCGNGYFGWRMLGAGARCVIGVDPTLVYVMQWLAQRSFAPGLRNYVLPLRDRDLPKGMAGFDSVFSMGVLHHQREPETHLRQLLEWLKPGGDLVLETLVLDRPGLDCLVPAGRYARMRNVWHLPTPDLLIRELVASGFRDARLADLTATTTGEQRSTEWMRFESLEQCLDPNDPSLTVEGHPAPVRAVVLASA